MESRTPQRPADILAAALAAYQAAEVIPHCPHCARPCCMLDRLVLDLDWPQVKVLWRLDESRRAFDRRLAEGRGPAEIRAAHGRYYAHTRPCPAYDLERKTCGVYGQPAKPVGCSDFPVYDDGGVVVADLRCEAVDLAALKARLVRALGPQCRIVESADPDFPFLVSLSIERSVRRRGARSPG